MSDLHPVTPAPARRTSRTKPTLVDLPLDQLVLDRDLQPRVRLDTSTVESYAELYRDHGPNALAPIRAYADAEDRPVLTRGFTRVAAAKLAGLTALPGELFPAPKNELALLIDSLSGNCHGQPLSNADKRRGLALYHEQVERDAWQTTREVAALMGCSHELVASFRRELDQPSHLAEDEPEDLAPPAEADGTEPEELTVEDQPAAEAPAPPAAPAPATPEPPTAIVPRADLATRRAAWLRNYLVTELQTRAKFRGSAGEFAALLLIVGLDTSDDRTWSETLVQRSQADLAQRLAENCAGELRAGQSHRLPDWATLAGLWSIDYDAARILADRSVVD